MPVYTLFQQTGGDVIAADTAIYTLTMEFALSAPGALTGIWFYSASGAAVLPDACCIFQVTGQSQVPGTVNTTPSWSGAAGSTWVKCAYPGTTTLQFSTNYRVAVHLPGGANAYSATHNYWTAGGPGQNGLTNGIISAPNSTNSDVGQGAFFSGGSVLTYPNSQFLTSNYWVDVEITTGSGPVVIPIGPGRTWKRYHSLGFQRPPQPSQPVTSSGSVALAPMAMHASASVLFPSSPERPPPAQPGRTWMRRFRRPPVPVPPVFLPFAIQGASASWSGSGVMSIGPVASGPDLANLWAAYMQAKQAAINAQQALRLARGAYNTDGWGYVMAAQFYVLDRAADQAYQAWATAAESYQRQLNIFAAYGGGQ